jgi:hypothetical protein
MRWSLTAAALVAAAGAAHAQDESGVPVTQNPVLFLEKSYLSPMPLTPTGKDLILEGQASGHYFIVNRLTDRTWERTGGFRVTVPVSMIFVVRIFDEDSAPVRTPSFILRPLYAQLVHLARQAERARLLVLGAGVTHHSNGQSGCTFLGEAPDPGGGDGCVVVDPALRARGLTNVVDGSFSTNFIPLDVGVRWARIDEALMVTEARSLRARFELHPKQFLKGGMSRSLATEYGQMLLGLGLEVERALGSGVGRVDGWAQSRFGPDKDGADWAGQLEVSYVLKKAENVGFFLRWHLGSDYYNIRFSDDRGWLQLGLMWDPGRQDRFEHVRPERRPERRDG